MKFIVSRSSLCDDNDVKPCDGAVRKKFIKIDTRTVSKPEDVPAYRGKSDWWYNEGTNHRLINNEITRDLECEKWSIEISSLEELMKFMEDVDNKIIIKNIFTNKDIKEIEIYDDYRE